MTRLRGRPLVHAQQDVLHLPARRSPSSASRYVCGFARRKQLRSDTASQAQGCAAGFGSIRLEADELSLLVGGFGRTKLDEGAELKVLRQSRNLLLRVCAELRGSAFVGATVIHVPKRSECLGRLSIPVDRAEHSLIGFGDTSLKDVSSERIR